ncbi:hypothetical protein U1Q18_047066, partial [Sarracenia purpurea var. burkii]
LVRILHHTSTSCIGVVHSSAPTINTSSASFSQPPATASSSHHHPQPQRRRRRTITPPRCSFILGKTLLLLN